MRVNPHFIVLFLLTLASSFCSARWKHKTGKAIYAQEGEFSLEDRHHFSDDKISNFLSVPYESDTGEAFSGIHGDYPDQQTEVDGETSWDKAEKETNSVIHNDDSTEYIDEHEDNSMHLDSEISTEEPSSGENSPAESNPTKQSDDPLNFLNLAGTDFQPGRLVNIFFGLIIMIFMIVIHGYILWVVGIAYLPGTRALQDWTLNQEVLENLTGKVLQALDYWEIYANNVRSNE
jgi:hypothetical protein